MSVKEMVRTVRTCDVCKKDVSGFAKVGECVTVAIYSITKMTYYGQEETLDVCPECSSKLLVFIDNIQKESTNECTPRP